MQIWTQRPEYSPGCGEDKVVTDAHGDNLWFARCFKCSMERFGIQAPEEAFDVMSRERVTSRNVYRFKKRVTTSRAVLKELTELETMSVGNPDSLSKEQAGIVSTVANAIGILSMNKVVKNQVMD